MSVSPQPLARRERQLLETLHVIGEGSVKEVRAAMTDAPSYSAVRTMLNILVEKGHLKYRLDGRSYRYRPAETIQKRRKSYLRRAIDLAFGGQEKLACASLIDMSVDRLSVEELRELEESLRQARLRKEQTPSKPADSSKSQGDQ